MARTRIRLGTNDFSGTKGIWGTLALGAAALLAAVGPASAQGSGAPDLGHYCRAHHGAQALAVFRRATGRWVCAEQRGFERRYHRIDYAAACRLTFGAGGLRPAAGGAICDGTTTDGAVRDTDSPAPRGGRHAYRQVIPNLSGYCRRTFGRYARVAFDRTTGLYACAASRRRRGGIVLRSIDMAAACYFTVRSTNFRFDGDRREIRCLVSV